MKNENIYALTFVVVIAALISVAYVNQPVQAQELSEVSASAYVDEGQLFVEFNEKANYVLNVYDSEGVAQISLCVIQHDNATMKPPYPFKADIKQSWEMSEGTLAIENLDRNTLETIAWEDLL